MNGGITMDITETTKAAKKNPLTKDEIIQELMDLLKQNNMSQQSNDVFEICSYVDGIEKKLDSMTAELTQVREQIKEMQEDTMLNNLKKSVTEAANRLENRCNLIKEEIFTIKTNIQTKAADIVREAKRKGKEALNQVSEIFGVKEKLTVIREQVKESKKEVAATLDKIDAFEKGMREASQQIANTFRTFADKETVDYSEQEKKFSKTEVLKTPWKAEKKILSGLELRLDAAIDKVDNLSKDVEISRMMKQYDEAMASPHENMAAQTVAATGLVAEPKIQYGAEAFEEARKMDVVKAEVSAKVVEPIKAEKAR